SALFLGTPLGALPSPLAVSSLLGKAWGGSSGVGGTTPAIRLLSCGWAAVACRLIPDSTTAMDSSPTATTSDHQRGQRSSTRTRSCTNMAILRNRSDGFSNTPVAPNGTAGLLRLSKNWA